MNDKLIDLLVCPENHSRLAFADVQLLARINAAIAGRRLTNRVGRTLEEPLAAALVRADQALAYPLIDDIPLMVVDESIPLAQLDA